MTGTNCDLFTHNQSRSYLNHLVIYSCCFVSHHHCIAPQSLLHRTVTVLHRTVTVLPRTVTVLHRTVTVLPRTVTMLHRTVTTLHRTVTVLHRTVTMLHRTIPAPFCHACLLLPLCHSATSFVAERWTGVFCR